MRRVRLLLSVAALVTLAGLFAPAHAETPPADPTGTSAAPAPSETPTSEAAVDPEPAFSTAAACSQKPLDGKVYLYRYKNCGEVLCSAGGDDLDYSNDSGCAGSDNDRTSSVHNRGYANGWGIVAVYRDAGADGSTGYFCVHPGNWVDDLDDPGDNDYFAGTNVLADNRASSHRWERSCSHFPW
ncbi:hypothetical protein ACFXJ8_34285 [Nonomuraea sp. NPDC059194]|uniref:hypothetical protein n=1 Tax=Nonomuraea sp. NPDC059194 TaxID=3346764 RepID=UPI0036CC1025